MTEPPRKHTGPASQRIEVTLPDLGLGDSPLKVSVWLVDEGADVSQGDRLLELLSPNVTIDLPAPAAGVLREQLVSEGDLLSVGQVLGILESAPGESPQ